MLFKKTKKLPVFQSAVLLLVIAFAVIAAACSGDDASGGTQGGSEAVIEITKDYVSGEDALDWGVSANANVLTLGLTPGNDTTEINLNWYSTGAQAGKSAEVRFIRGKLSAGTELITKTGTVNAASTGFSAHKVTVTGLKPGSSYQYAVSSDGADWSEAYDFKVPSATGAFKFAVVADPQLTTGNVDSKSRYSPTPGTTAAGWLETMKIIAEKGVSFIASGGDQVDASSGNENEYNNFFAPPELRNIPFSPVAGNHDRHLHYNYHYNWPNAQTFADETTETVAGRNYFYLYNNILFVVLNTAPYPTANGSASGDKDVTTALAHTARFRSTIRTAKKANEGKYDWIIVQHHKSTASVAEHIADKDIQAYVEAGFETIMSEEGVDFVLAGHDHVYARSYPLAGKDNGKVSVPDKSKGGNTVTNPGNPIYLTFTTASGLKYYQVSADKTYPFTASVVNNTEYPYLGTITGANGDEATLYGSAKYTEGNLPVSTLAFVQPYIPSYTIVEVNGKTIKFSTYAVASVSGTTPGATEAHIFDKDIPYDWVEVTKN